mmetsp:Transcript_8428/g.12845  ORF Transcript_8428/g.12845 Transcript_8428/m.12845 type:complete len:162 (+) Transcript_8428:431-916(+)|eukprot:CAMPEP_0170496030 /NCGR_PEP_ID=MMETSP0208-20121228/19681_1 /TAXON_ID=197538 /ORGANISM="Strombidium inclinatum, Strain S3" /LENGTH=161 /DNA_ID=CAMNT_0010772453 /DNA_START=373 /DNA_END=858 /DNA_ORIENTATION=-
MTNPPTANGEPSLIQNDIVESYQADSRTNTLMRNAKGKSHGIGSYGGGMVQNPDVRSSDPGRLQEGKAQMKSHRLLSMADEPELRDVQLKRKNQTPGRKVRIKQDSLSLQRGSQVPNHFALKKTSFDTEQKAADITTGGYSGKVRSSNFRVKHYDNMNFKR